MMLENKSSGDVHCYTVTSEGIVQLTACLGFLANIGLSISICKFCEDAKWKMKK